MTLEWIDIDGAGEWGTPEGWWISQGPGWGFQFGFQEMVMGYADDLPAAKAACNLAERDSHDHR